VVEPTPRTERGAVDRLYEVDALRIFAAVAVMLYHYGFANFAAHYTDVEYRGLGVVTRYGYLGVDLFFVISGFVVLLSALGRRPEQFVISRIVRLYPAYWVAVTITSLVLVFLSAGEWPVTAVQYLANMTMFNALPNIPNIDVVYWTLWVELRFYAVILVLTFVGITRGRVLAVLWGWLAAAFLLAAGILPSSVQNLAGLVVQPEWAHYFIAGMAMCLIYRFGLSLQPVLIILIAFGRAVPVAIDFARRVSERYQEHIHPAAVVVVISIVFVAMTLVALRVTRRIGRPWFVVLGALTYPLYLVHDRVGIVLFDRLDDYLNRWVLLAVAVGVMLGVAWLIHRFVERPFAPVLRRGLTRILPGRAGSRTEPVRAAR
jgi:peptidoglycan/LPS O-acetylase OafA/YrhL